MDEKHIMMSQKAVDGYYASGFELYEDEGQYRVVHQGKVVKEFNDIKKLEKFFEKVYEKTLYTVED